MDDARGEGGVLDVAEVVLGVDEESMGVIDRQARAVDLHQQRADAGGDVDGRGEVPEWLYTVVFEAAELWGRDADPASRVSIDAWESYLEPA